MSPGIDAQRPPHGEIAARRLVEAVQASDDRVERHFLEVKSDVDLRTPLGRAKVAKFILGAANRMPDVARRYFGGHAVMILGVGGGDAPGIEPFEMLQLEQWLNPYFPSPPPRWDISRVPLPNGNEVLLVIVDPPEQGQAMFFCRRAFDGDGNRKYALRDGAVYVRSDGATSEASSAQIEALLQRGSGQARAEVSLVAQGAALRYIADTGGLERWVSKTRDDLLAALPSPASATGFDKLGGAAARHRFGLQDAFTDPEDRTETDYRAEIEAWVNDCMEAMPTALDAIAASAWTPLTFRLDSDSWLEDAEVQIHLDGEVEGVEGDRYSPRRGIRDLFPSAPRKWGPRPNNLAAISRAVSYTPQVFSPTLPPPGGFSNGGSVTVTELLGDVRPESSVLVAEHFDMVLLVKEIDLARVTASWRVTARGRHIYRGQLVVPIETRHISDLIRFRDSGG